MASTSNIREECKICQEQYKDPHILECGHSFCKICIGGITKEIEEKQHITCPLCNAVCTSSTKNYAMVELLEYIDQMRDSDRIRDLNLKQIQADPVYRKHKAWSLHHITGKQWTRQKTIKLEQVTNNMRFIDGMLWTCHSGGCTVFNLDLLKVKTIRFSLIAKCRNTKYIDGKRLGPTSLTLDQDDKKLDDSAVYDIAREVKNTLIVASDSGLWRAFDNGIYQKKINETSHTGIYASAARVCFITTREISMTNMSGETIKYNSDLLHTASTSDGQYGGRILTVALIENDVLVCNSPSSKIECFSLDGKMGHTKQTSDGANYAEVIDYTCFDLIDYGNISYNDKFEMDNPFICCSDNDGNVLIADCSNDRLLLRRPEGKYEELDLQPPVIAPNCAVYYNGKLFVVSWHHRKLYRYEFAADGKT